MEDGAASLLFVSPRKDLVEALNSLLRRNAVAAQCTWVASLADLAGVLTRTPSQLLLLAVFRDEDNVATAAALRDQHAPGLPLIVVRQEVDEALMSADLEHGARDSVSLGRLPRLLAVVKRELTTRRLEQTLHSMLRRTQDPRRQVEALARGRQDAIAEVQEDTVVEANAPWLELFGHATPDELEGKPVMGLFDEGSRPALRGALLACVGGRWKEHDIIVGAVRADGTRFPLAISLALADRNGEPSVRLVIPALRPEDRGVADDLEDAVRHHPRTGYFYRQPLLEAIAGRLAKPVQGGRRFLLCIRVDHFSDIERQLGMLASEDFVQAMADIVRAQTLPNDIVGHFNGGIGLMALLERGTERDAETWAERLIERISHERFQFGEKTVKATITIGLAFVPNTTPALDVVAADALDAMTRGRQAGGNQLFAFNRIDSDTRVQIYDAVWVQMIKDALMEDRFFLVQQPIAGLQGQNDGLSDVLVRMIDPTGAEVLPSEFLPPAERNDLLKNIDRWVIATALRLAAERKQGCLFIRLSSASTVDPTLITWLDAQLKASQVDPRAVCIQIAEDVARRHLYEASRLAAALHERRVRIAIEHFGVADAASALLDKMTVDYVKIDGSLLQGLKENRAAQQRIGTLVADAHAHEALVIAERVEDANTMAVLWPLGMNYVQGFFLQQPEDVVIG